jgi:hypothetical protein
MARTPLRPPLSWRSIRLPIEGSRLEVLQLGVEVVGDHAVHQSLMRNYRERPLTIQVNLETTLRHGGFIELDHASQKFVQIDLPWRKAKCVGLGFGNIERFVEEVGEPIQFSDRGCDGFGLFSFTRRKRGLQLPRIAVSGLRRSCARESVIVCSWCIELSMRSSIRFSVSASWAISSFLLLVGTRGPYFVLVLN